MRVYHGRYKGWDIYTDDEREFTVGNPHWVLSRVNQEIYLYHLSTLDDVRKYIDGLEAGVDRRITVGDGADESRVAVEVYLRPTEVFLKMGRCESCRHLHCDTYDPSPGGVALGSGHITDCGCDIEDEVFQKTQELGFTDEEYQNVGTTVDCPLWEMKPYKYCEKHHIWYEAGEFCPFCAEEEMREMYEACDDQAG